MIARGVVVIAVLAGGCAYDRPAFTGGDDAAAIDAAVAPLDAVDARVDAGDTGRDSDGDTHPDSVDNCDLIVNPAQDDDDGDGVGDVCDLCPYQSDANPPSNIDGDGIGDGCGDPAVDRPQCIVWFDGFSAARTLGRYGTAGGTWTIANGGLVQATAAATAYLRVADLSFVRPFVVTAVSVTALATNVPTFTVGVAADLSALSAATPDGYLGGLTRPGTGTETRVTLSEVRGSVAVTVTSAAAAPLLADSTAATISLDARTSQIRAAVERNNVVSDVTDATTNVADAGAGLYLTGVSARFDYLMILADRGNGPCPTRTEP